MRGDATSVVMAWVMVKVFAALASGTRLGIDRTNDIAYFK